MSAIYLQNRLPTKLLNVTPYEKWTGSIPDLSHLQIFGCKAFAHVPDVKRRKLDSKAIQLTFVGYDDHSKLYALLDVKTNKIIISRDVKYCMSNTMAYSN